MAPRAYTQDMDNNKPLNQFQEVHRLVQERLDHVRDAQVRDSELRRKRAQEEAIREGFDRD